jgi:pimeloyl-ACP methyl ester carboxylesterase
MPETIEPSKVLGRGPIRLIAVAGWMGDHHLFDPMLPFFDDQQFTVALLDARGYGSRRNVAGPFTIEQIAEDMLACADGLGWDRFHVLGHSMAGMSAQRIIVDAPQRIVSAILVAPVPASGARIDQDRWNLLVTATTDPDARKRLIDVNTGRVQADDWLSTLRDVSVAGTRPDALQAYMLSWTGPGFQEEIRDVTVPVHVAIGRLDPSASESRLRDSIGSWFGTIEFSVLEGCGHYPMWERPKDFYHALIAGPLGHAS